MLEETKSESACGQPQMPLEFVAGMRQEKYNGISLVGGDSALLLPAQNLDAPWCVQVAFDDLRAGS